MIKLKCGLLSGNQLICSSVIDLLISSEESTLSPLEKRGGKFQRFFWRLKFVMQSKSYFKQACIPVGCVPPASVAATRCQS